MRLVMVGVLLAAANSAVLAGPQQTRVEFTPFAGYFAGGSVDFPISSDDSVELDIQGAGDYGALLDFMVSPESAVGVMYLLHDSAIDGDPAAGTGEVGLRTEFYHFEGFYEFAAEGARPFVVGSV